MTSIFKTQNLNWLLFLALMVTSLSVAQRDTEKWKLQASLGVNHPMDNGANEGYFSKYVNFPSLNLGVQRMFSEKYGVKLDLGYNRSSEGAESLPFKLNYTRINAQLVYDSNNLFNFLPRRMAVIAHAGPGVTMSKPLGLFVNNTYSYFNVMGGVEVHYGLSEKLSVFADASYVLSLSGKNKYDFPVDGFSFNGDLVYVALGISLSLSGCYYC